MKIGKTMAATALGLTMALGSAMAAGSQTDKTGAAQTMEKQDKRNDLRTQGGNDQTGTTGNTAATPGTTSTQWYSAKTAAELEGKDVSNQAGDEVGSIERIVRDTDGEPHAVVSVGGFLGIGDKEVLIPLSRMTMGENNVILLSAEDEDQLKQMPAYDEKVEGYVEVKGDEPLGM